MKTSTEIIAALFALFAGCTWAENEPLDKNSSSIQSWANGVQSISYGSDVSSIWKKPNNALGHAEGTSGDIVCLGRSGQITLSFPQGISNGSGNDFGIFENGMSDTFLELGWVEVSSDNIHFIRFANASQTEDPIGGFGEVDNTLITGLASKYRQGTGTLFDLEHLQVYYDYVTQGINLGLTTTYKNHLQNNFPHLDLNNIQYVRIIDIVGDGSAIDAFGHTIYDPYPTTGSAGFDLDAIAVLHEGTTAPPPPPNTFANWSFTHSLSGTPSDDFDGDGNADLEEYFLGTSPTNVSERASFSGTPLSNQFEIVYHRDPDALGTIDIKTIGDLTHTNWVVATPDSVTSNTTPESIEIKVLLPATVNQSFYRLQFEGADE